MKVIPLPPSPEVNGCNSEDEYENRPHAQLTEEEWVEVRGRTELQNNSIVPKLLILMHLFLSNFPLTITA
jgi:hypothetical protein